MNYRHAFHAGNHADVLKHAVLLELCDALTAKPAPLFALDTHAGRGLYALDGAPARRTGEADDGIGRLTAPNAGLRRYLEAIDACRAEHGERIYPGSPWLLAHALREQDRIACCEIVPDEVERLRVAMASRPQVAVHARDGYGALHALLPPRSSEARIGRGLVLIDPAYENQMGEFDIALPALRDALGRFPQGTYALWYPIKLRRALQPVYRRAATLPAKSVLAAEVLVRKDDSPLRMNGSGLLIVNPPWKLDNRLRVVLPALAQALGEDAGAGWRMDWIVSPP
ncbi:MAG: 23S rRNA (adenine(2030)-N(6))-methyltransferase RlmJ [Lysobacter sp.]|nr:MAG: 23S rRNA (adenine(2030)-N(6))-methyltransferase RlmJ [Lysobacter sp.]